jgi:hypothetical protein
MDRRPLHSYLGSDQEIRGQSAGSAGSFHNEVGPSSSIFVPIPP